MNLLLAITIASGLIGVAPDPAEAALSLPYIVQSNDIDPTLLTSQPNGRWYHWLGADPVVTHLETGLGIDADRLAGRGQKIEVAIPAPLTAIQVKVKRIGQPGPLVWQAGTAWGQADLGQGQVPPERVSVNYEQFVTLPLSGAMAKTVYLQFRAAAGQCPDDYYAVYCTWTKKNCPVKAKVDSYMGPQEADMAYRMIRPDPHGAALESDGRPAGDGASMMTRLLTSQAGANRRQLLPGEEDPYHFAEDLTAGVDPRREGLPWPDVRPEPDELLIGPDWTVEVAAPESPEVRTAVSDLEQFLKVSMQRRLRVVWDQAARPAQRTITISQGPGLPDGPQRPAGYRFVAAGDQVHVHGYDPRGVLRGIWYLEDLLALRGGPCLKRAACTRQPRWCPRATCAAWAGTGELATPAPIYTDGHLSLVSHYGYDAIWLVWCPGPERDAELPTRIEPGQVPRGTTYQPFTARLRDLTQRAARYDLEVIVLYAAPHPQNEEDARTLQEHTRQMLRDVPLLKTIVLLDEGMGSRRKGVGPWVETCNLLARATWEVRPEARVVAWRYSFRYRNPERATWDQCMEQFSPLDPGIAYMANFDSYWARRRDGTLQGAFDYCLSLKAPSEDFVHGAEFLKAQAEHGGQRPRPLWAKIESRFSQESNTQPEIPCMQRWAERYAALNRFDVLPIEGVIANWYHQGFFPTPVTELFGWLAYTDPPPTDELLRAMARRDFGPGQEDLVLAAWQDFSEAIWHYPFYFNLSYSMNSGPAQPFWLDPGEPNPRAWRRGFVNSSKAMSLESTGQGRGSGPENRARLAQLQSHWNAGLAKLRRAAAAAPPCVRSRAASNLRVAAAFGDKADVTLRLVRWFDARDRLGQAKTVADRKAALDELEHVGREELDAARAVLPDYLRDSRLGHLNHGRGCFTALTILDKIALLERTLAEELPSLRNRAP